jgi:hypothetical protein
MPLANYLRRRGATYSARVPVPKDLWEATGKREVERALGKVRDLGRLQQNETACKGFAARMHPYVAEARLHD